MIYWPIDVAFKERRKMSVTRWYNIKKKHAKVTCISHFRGRVMLSRLLLKIIKKVSLKITEILKMRYTVHVAYILILMDIKIY